VAAGDPSSNENKAHCSVTLTDPNFRRWSPVGLSALLIAVSRGRKVVRLDKSGRRDDFAEPAKPVLRVRWSPDASG